MKADDEVSVKLRNGVDDADGSDGTMATMVVIMIDIAVRGKYRRDMRDGYMHICINRV